MKTRSSQIDTLWETTCQNNNKRTSILYVASHLKGFWEKRPNCKIVLSVFSPPCLSLSWWPSFIKDVKNANVMAESL